MKREREQELDIQHLSFSSVKIRWTNETDGIYYQSARIFALIQCVPFLNEYVIRLTFCIVLFIFRNVVSLTNIKYDSMKNDIVEENGCHTFFCAHNERAEPKPYSQTLNSIFWWKNQQQKLQTITVQLMGIYSKLENLQLSELFWRSS